MGEIQSEESVGDSKSILSSKVVGANTLMLVVIPAAQELFPIVKPWIASHPNSMLLLCGLVNIALRPFTNGKVHLFNSK